jgi:hypothetical protein
MMQTIYSRKKESVELDALVASVSALDELELIQFFEKLNQRIAQTEQPIARQKQEILLLKQIKAIIPRSVVRRFKELQRKQHQYRITPPEAAEILLITDFIEEKSAERIPLLAALAQLRQVTLPDLVKQLNLKNFHA